MSQNHIVELRKLIEKGIEEITLPQNPSKLYEPMRYILSLGGKRVRPTLTLLGAELFGVSPKQALNQALAVEVFHNFTLVHDDIMDRADVRRGTPTVHKKWDDNVAILSGDGMMVLAYQLLTKANSEKIPQLIETFSNTALEVCEGQQYDMDLAHAETVQMPEYIEMIRLKTAVLLTCSMQLGAILGGASQEDLHNLKLFAENIGLAFQIKDDFLDAFGDEAAFGKKIGGDIAEGKRTWLTVKALEIGAGQEISEDLLQAYKMPNAEERIAVVLGIYEVLSIRDLANQAIEEYSEKAMKALYAIQGDAKTKETLTALVDLLMNRNS